MTTIDKEYKIIPLHKRPDLIPDCCTLLNSEWPRSETARLKFLNVSCDEFPTCLILVDKEDRVLGHCKISLIPRLRHSCFIQSVIIDYQCRSQGLGSKLLRGAEEHVAKKGIKNVYLITKAFTKAKLKEKSTQCCGPPPPPMPNFQMPKFYDLGVITHRTHMVKKLSLQ
ncbi:N-alpha-acetyltransferase 80 isoform X2 [Apis cerana]|uniref:N-alpha-acetyltransferase 80 isoform X2 n=1 Tax=Apis cerana TaxID=7461 RepID=UPI002B224229|nr:N-alpha-acetyltransferase 80 isoform X2 [Apis cerana]XP_061930924.1 N-alpha-acetyltransferase 80 isoform X2 [Apis cerana]